jgi:exonuclease SbcD
MVHGQSFATRAVTQDLSKAYPPPRPGWFDIGVLHTNVNGFSEHENYAPSNLNDLRNHGYGYWALGHVHTRAELSRDPWIIYPGNLQGRHVRETGAKGAYLVTVTDGQIAGEPAFIAFDTVRWEQLEVDVSAAVDEDAALTMARDALAHALNTAGGRLLVARMTLTGATPAFKALSQDIGATREKLQAEAVMLAGQDAIWIEGVNLLVRPPGIGQPAPDVLRDQIAALAGTDLADGAARYGKEMLGRLAGLRDALGKDHPAVALADSGVPPDALLERARSLLRARLETD